MMKLLGVFKNKYTEKNYREMETYWERRRREEEEERRREELEEEVEDEDY